MDFSIPLKASSGGGSSAANYSTTVDSSYSIYNAQLKNYPFTNAFTDVNISQEKWGLQGITERTAQNNIWKWQLSFGTTNGTGALSRHSITYPFTSNIKVLEDASIQTWFYTSPKSIVTFDETNNKIVNNGASLGNFTDDIFQKKSYIATAGWNKFIIIAQYGAPNNIAAFPIDANGAITSTTPTSTITTGQINIFWGSYILSYNRPFVTAAKNDFIWATTFSSYYDPSPRNISVSTQSQIIQISPLWIMSLVGTVDADAVWPGTANTSATATSEVSAIGSYVDGNTAHVVWLYHYNNSTGERLDARVYFTIDLSNTTTHTSTVITQSGVLNAAALLSSVWVENSIDVWFDWTKALVVTAFGWATPDIYQLDSGWFVDTWFNATAPQNYVRQYRHSTAELSTDTNQVRTDATAFKVKWVNSNWTLTNLPWKTLWMYEMTGSNNESQQSALKAVYIPASVVWTGTLTLKANGTAIDTNVLSNTINVPVSQIMNATNVAINSDRIDFELSYDNLDAREAKIGFWLNGWTYDSPTGNYETSTINITL